MKRRPTNSKRTSASESDEAVANDTVAEAAMAHEPASCADGPLLRPSFLVTGGSRRTRVGAARRPLPRLDGDLAAMTDGGLGRLGNDTVSDALLAGWGMREISSILRWALSDLAVTLMEVERRILVADDNGGPARRRTPARTARN